MQYKYISFKEFCDWCTCRAGDGFWSKNTAITCMAIGDAVYKKWFSWRRERYWREIFEKDVREQIVNPTERAIVAYKKSMGV